MTDEAGSVETGVSQRVRVDWRTGLTMVQNDEAVWRDHERRRLA
ncbi:hypothetical protein [Variovorax rhizosphaerae]|uniref:Uncharacterized protein n=1 Tax=Variovorax rhizosphaerae TaxID=1836200 RepID=A0ABU8WRJ4_9BURK